MWLLSAANFKLRYGAIAKKKTGFKTGDGFIYTMCN